MEAEVRLSGSAGGGETWLLAEGWWAEAYPAPTYSELVSWSATALPWAVAIHVAERYWQIPGGWSWRNVPAYASVFAQLVGALILAPVFYLLLAAVMLVGVLPIPKLRELIVGAQATLAGTVGDCLAFVESPLRGALIRTRIRDRIRRLRRRCRASSSWPTRRVPPSSWTHLVESSRTRLMEECWTQTTPTQPVSRTLWSPSARASTNESA
jgi:hypothetical protein